MHDYRYFTIRYKNIQPADGEIHLTHDNLEFNISRAMYSGTVTALPRKNVPTHIWYQGHSVLIVYSTYSHLLLNAVYSSLHPTPPGEWHTVRCCSTIQAWLVLKCNKNINAFYLNMISLLLKTIEHDLNQRLGTE